MAGITAQSLEEITVTARKKVETLLDVPVDETVLRRNRLSSTKRRISTTSRTRCRAF